MLSSFSTPLGDRPSPFFMSAPDSFSRFAASGAAARRVSDESYEIQLFVPLHLRFLDIQYRHHRPRGERGTKQSNLYNKLVWPVLYKHVFPELLYGLTDEVRRELNGELKRAVEA